jgi:hypothetical protein
MSQWKLHIPDETNRITAYKCGLVAGQHVRLKKDLTITCEGVPTGSVHHAGEEWVVLTGITTDPVLWFRRPDGEMSAPNQVTSTDGEWRVLFAFRAQWPATAEFLRSACPRKPTFIPCVILNRV